MFYCFIVLLVPAVQPTPLLKVPVERLKDGSSDKFRVADITEEDLLKAGLRRLDADFPSDDLLKLPRRSDGSAQLLRESIVQKLLTRTLDLKSIDRSALFHRAASGLTIKQ